MAQAERMVRQVRLYQDEVQRIRDLVTQGKRDLASQLLTQGAAVDHMKQLREASVMMTETIDNVELWMAEERASRA